MQYRADKYQNHLSILGFGCMRFPRKGGVTDLKATEALISRALELGINYFDTAYVYPGSEAALGQVLERLQARDRVFIATKLPHYLIKTKESLERSFQQQLSRLRTDHVDYYLMHMLTDVGTWQRLQALGIEAWLQEKVASGQIGQVGFSYHGNAPMFCRLVDSYPWDFCQIQYNYMDEHSQAGRRGLQYAHKKGLPVIIMEPLRGGRLAQGLPKEAKNQFRHMKPSQSPAQWGLQWLWDQEEVTCVLSGMKTLEVLEENARTAQEVQVHTLTAQQLEGFRQVVQAISAGIPIGCTGCGYCMPCPKNVDIPGSFAAYNRRYTDGKFAGLKDYAMCTALRRDPSPASNCIGCGKCESHCPQSLPIRELLKQVARELEGPAYRLACKISRKWIPF